MDRYRQTARILFALGMIGLGILGLTVGDFALQWQPVPAWVPWREGLAYASGVIMLAGGVGLLFGRTAALSARILFPYLLAWWLLLKVPKVVAAPLIAQPWLGCGEIAVLLAGGWVLFASLAASRDESRLNFAVGERGIRFATILFAVALPAIGLSHFVYARQTAALVPAWLPWRIGWAYLTGVGHVAAGIGVLFSIYPRLAATMEAGMLSAFTILVWIPAIVAAPTARLPWTAFVISWAITAGAFVVASSIVERKAAADSEPRASEVGVHPEQPAVHVGVHQESPPVVVDREIAVARHGPPVSRQIGADHTDGLP
jgi:uncharacterized membrane protein